MAAPAFINHISHSSSVCQSDSCACSRQREFLQAHVAKNIVVAATCGTIFWMQGKESEALPTFSNSSFNVSSLWYFAMLYTILSNLQIIPQLFFFRVSSPP